MRQSSVRFVPGTDTGWTVGEGGKILKSVDGGATWTRQRNASHVFNLIDVSFADVNNGWTVGGEELHTTDGGQTWVKQDAGVFASVSVYALSPTEAWVGGLGSMARTTTGGASWSIESPSATDWFTMNFLDIDNGWGRRPGSNRRRRAREHMEERGVPPSRRPGRGEDVPRRVARYQLGGVAGAPFGSAAAIAVRPAGEPAPQGAFAR